MTSKNKIFIIAGPSAVGKNAIIEELIKSDLPVRRMLTTTSRAPRPSDQPMEYHFVSRDEFQSLIDADAMIEWVEYNKNLYGTRKQDLQDILDAGQNPIMDIDIRGVDFFEKHFDNAVSIFILPKSLEVLRQRLEDRGTKESDIQDRIETAKGEIAQANRCDYQVVNEDGHLDRAVGEIIQIIRDETA